MDKYDINEALFELWQGTIRRDLFAGLAMAGLCANPDTMYAMDGRNLDELMADKARKRADALIAELDKNDG
jgi:hypothetical protein